MTFLCAFPVSLETLDLFYSEVLKLQYKGNANNF